MEHHTPRAGRAAKSRSSGTLLSDSAMHALSFWTLATLLGLSACMSVDDGKQIFWQQFCDFSVH